MLADFAVYKMDDDLATADSIVSAKTLPPPPITEDDRKLVREFCTQSLELQSARKAAAAAKKDCLETQRKKRKVLMDWIRAQGQGRCFVIPRSAYSEAEQAAAKQGFEGSVPPYLRLQRTTTDANITAEVAETSVMDLDAAVVKEHEASGKNPMQALISAIVDNARAAIRTNRESVLLSSSVEKGMKVMEVPELPSEAAEHMVGLHFAVAKAKQIAASCKPKTASATEKIKQLEPGVASFLEKSGRNTQQVRLSGGGLHRIAAKESSRSSKVTLKVFEDAVATSITSLGFQVDSVDAALSSLEQKKKQLVKAIQLHLNGLPKKTTTKVVFKSIREEADAVEEEDEENGEDEKE